jgi:hypothetical protein
MVFDTDLLRAHGLRSEEGHELERLLPLDLERLSSSRPSSMSEPCGNQTTLAVHVGQGRLYQSLTSQ